MVRDVMSREVVTLPYSMPVKQVLEQFFDGANGRKHQGYPVVDDRGRLVGIVTRSNLLDPALLDPVSVLVADDILEREPVTASAEESCRSAAERMAQAGVGRLVVVAEDDPKRLVGIVTRSDLLKPRATRADEEERRERFFNLRFPRTSAPNRP
jgi:CBS domain-containing protein